jgi:hypothetical protein
MADIFFIAIAFYILYKLVFDFVVPVYKTTILVKSQFKNMHDQREKQANDFQQPANPPKEKKNSTVGEYIDFEEVKK